MRYRIKKVYDKAIRLGVIIDCYFIVQWSILGIFWFNHTELQGFPLEEETVIYPSFEDAVVFIHSKKHPKKIKSEIIQK